MGLEDDETLQEVEGARWSLHISAVASSRAQPAPHGRLGRTHQILGLRHDCEGSSDTDVRLVTRLAAFVFVRKEVLMAEAFRSDALFTIFLYFLS